MSFGAPPAPHAPSAPPAGGFTVVPGEAKPPSEMTTSSGQRLLNGWRAKIDLMRASGATNDERLQLVGSVGMSAELAKAVTAYIGLTPDKTPLPVPPPPDEMRERFPNQPATRATSMAQQVMGANQPGATAGPLGAGACDGSPRVAVGRGLTCSPTSTK
jgi:hypothetical protein